MTHMYNEIMSGVDLSDQKVSVYDNNRKSSKWWKKVFVRLLMCSVVYSWICFKLLAKKKELSLKNFLIPLAEFLCHEGVQRTTMKWKKVGRPSDIFIDVWEHLPTEGQKRRRCAECSKKKENKNE